VLKRLITALWKQNISGANVLQWRIDKEQLPGLGFTGKPL
jgi:hypothetical protein